jgi:alpha-N-arabinofuranosidase
MYPRAGLLVPFALFLIAGLARAQGVSLALDPEKVVNRVDERIYGHFLEHIYHSVNGGLWGETVWNRSFEQWPGSKRKGAPRDTKPPAAASHWKFYGEGQGGRSLDDALNGKAAQVVTSTGTEAGVAQAHFCVRAGETYFGSLWARGKAPDGLVVCLRDGDTTLAEIRLPAPEGGWREHTFRLQPKAAARDATLQVGVRGTGTVRLDQVSLVPQSARDAGGFRPDLLRAVADLKPPVIRWPGGSFAERYSWKDGIGPQHRRGSFPFVIWDDMDVNSLGTDEFLALCRRVGAEPLIVINIGSHRPKAEQSAYLQEAVDWVEYCNGPATSKWGKVRAANGHPEPYRVRLWEIDNETWLGSRMSPEAYAEAVREFTAAMKKADPTIKIIACGSGGLAPVGGGKAEWGLLWNRKVLEGCADVIDYLSVHHYESPARFAKGPGVFERFLRETGKLIAGSKNPKVKIYVSEWNAQSTDWRTGLYAGGLLNAFERCGDVVEIGGPALFLRHVSARAWDNAFINFDHCGWFPAPNYVVMRLWREHYAPQRIAVSGDAGPLNGVATKSADGKTLYYKAVNPTDRPVPVELRVGGGFAVGPASLQVVAPGSLEARNGLDRPDAVRVRAGKTDVDGQRVRFILPAYSAGVVTIPGRKADRPPGR